MSLLSCVNASIGYGGKSILSALSFDVCAGDYWCIIGDNGSGKSTLMRTLLGLQPPMSGSVIFGDGVQRNEVGYLPQQTQVQKDFPATVSEVVLSGCLNRVGLRPYYTKEEKIKAHENLTRLGIRDLSRRCYRELSGGQQQRVLLARALCATRKLLLLDEPVAGLDPATSESLYSLISGLNRDGLTILMVTHDMKAVDNSSSHVLRLSSSGIMFCGTRDEYTSTVGGVASV